MLSILSGRFPTQLQLRRVGAEHTCVGSSYLRVMMVVVEIVGVGSVGTPVARLLEHFLGFGCDPRLTLCHAALWWSGATRRAGRFRQKEFITYSLTNQEVFYSSRRDRCASRPLKIRCLCIIDTYLWMLLDKYASIWKSRDYAQNKLSK